MHITTGGTQAGEQPVQGPEVGGSARRPDGRSQTDGREVKDSLAGHAPKFIKAGEKRQPWPLTQPSPAPWPPLWKESGCGVLTPGRGWPVFSGRRLQRVDKREAERTELGSEPQLP